VKKIVSAGLKTMQLICNNITSPGQPHNLINKMATIDNVTATLPGIQRQVQVNPHSQELFSFKDIDDMRYSIVNIDGSKWTTSHGTEIIPRTDAIEFQYYIFSQDFQEAYKKTIINLNNIELNECSTYKHNHALAFMNFRQNNNIYSRLGCIQFIFIIWTVILTVAIIIGYRVYLANNTVQTQCCIIHSILIRLGLA
jgi:hypothetical protein